MFSSLKSSGTLLGTLPLNKVVIEQGAAKEEVKKSNSELPDHFNHLYDERAMITINQDDPSWRLNPKRF